MRADDKVILARMAEVLSDGKAFDPVILDLMKVTTMTDYFVIAHGSNTRQVQALARDLEERLAADLKVKPHHVEGATQGHWVLMDYGSIIVHIFLDEKRAYYGLERIWMDAPRVIL